MKSPKVTILVPTIGRLEYLPDTLASVRDQTFTDVEIIILDNASPAEAHEKLARWAGTDGRMRIERVEERLPMFANFNRGVSLARGKYVTFFHDDDVYTPRFVEALASGLDENARAGFAGSNIDYIDGSGRVTEHRRWIRTTGPMPGRQYVHGLVRRGRNLVGMPGLLYRREVLDGAFDSTLSMHFGDFVLLMRIAERWDLFLCAEALLHVRRHAEQASMLMPLSEGIPFRTRTMLQYLSEYLARHPEDAALVARLRRRTRLLHRVGMAWAWATASSSAEAVTCAGGLGDTVTDAAFRRVLLASDPLRGAFRNSTVRRVARKVGEVLGV